MAAQKIKNKGIPRQARPTRAADRSLAFVGGVSLIMMLQQMQKAGFIMEHAGKPAGLWEREVRLDGRIVIWRQWDA